MYKLNEYLNGNFQCCHIEDEDIEIVISTFKEVLKQSLEFHLLFIDEDDKITITHDCLIIEDDTKEMKMIIEEDGIYEEIENIEED